MTRRSGQKPPKKSARDVIKEYMGEESASSANESFRSPSTDVGATRYSLFSSSNTPKRNKNKSLEIEMNAAKNKSKKVSEISARRPSRSQQHEDTTTDDENSDVEEQIPSSSKQKTPHKPTKDPLRVSQRTSPRTKEIASSSRQQIKRTKNKQPIKKAALPKVYREIRYLQESTSLLCPRLPFSRLIREILISHDPDQNLGWHITPQALMALQESAEVYLTLLFQDANRCTIHRERKTLQPKDIQLVRYLRGPQDAGNF